MGKLFRALASFVFVLGLIGGVWMDFLCLLPLLLLGLGVELVAMYILASIFVSPEHAGTVAVVLTVLMVVFALIYAWAEDHQDQLF